MSSSNGDRHCLASSIACSMVGPDGYFSWSRGVKAKPIRWASLSSLSQRTFPWALVSSDANMRLGSGIFVLISPSIRTHLYVVSLPSMATSATDRTVDCPPSAPTRYLLQTGQRHTENPDCTYQRISRSFKFSSTIDTVILQPSERDVSTLNPLNSDPYCIPFP